ncbi:hypothetical protein GQ457_01G052490 [Hibiscus cannabinus]
MNLAATMTLVMNVERIEGQRRLPLSEPVQVNIGDDEARGAAICVLVNPAEVGLDRDGRPRQPMEDRDLLGLNTGVNIVGFGHLLDKTGQESYEILHHIWVLQLCHGS